MHINQQGEEDPHHLLIHPHLLKMMMEVMMTETIGDLEEDPQEEEEDPQEEEEDPQKEVAHLKVNPSQVSTIITPIHGIEEEEEDHLMEDPLIHHHNSPEDSNYLKGQELLIYHHITLIPS